MLSEIEFHDSQYENIMDLVKAVETEKIDLFNDVQGINPKIQWAPRPKGQKIL